jgi:hypothetical protein
MLKRDRITRLIPSKFGGWFPISDFRTHLEVPTKKVILKKLL